MKMKTAVVYSSTHHENTLKLLNAVKAKYEIDLINAEEVNNPDLTSYDLIGFAAGISFGRFYKSVTEALENSLPDGKKVFFIYTCGNNSRDFSANLRETAEKKNCVVLGSYGCRGFDTYGPFKLVGGINKNHPDSDEINGAVEFFERIKAM